MPSAPTSMPVVSNGLLPNCAPTCSPISAAWTPPATDSALGDTRSCGRYSPDAAVRGPLSTVPVRKAPGPGYSPVVRDLPRVMAGVLVGAALLTGCSDKVEANETLPSTSAAKTTEA